jgi:Tol biopolymer transport system component
MNGSLSLFVTLTQAAGDIKETAPALWQNFWRWSIILQMLDMNPISERSEVPMNKMKTVGILRAAAPAVIIICAIALAADRVLIAARPDARTGPVRFSPQLLGQPLGLFESYGDVGPVERPGRAVYDPQKQEYLIEGAGANMWFGTDEFQFAWKRLKGDFILSAKVEFMGQGVVAHRKIGWMVRSTPDPGSPHASAVVHGDGLTSLQFRKAPGKDTEEIQMPLRSPDIIHLERKGDVYVMSAARFGETFVNERVSGIGLGDEIYVGLFVCSHDAHVSEKARFSNVRIVIPAKEGFVPYQDYIGSNLEVMDVENGERTVVFQSPRSLQAPNWTADGKALIYNSEGLLYRFDLAAGAPSVLETGSAKDNNNDHVLSFDGQWIGISHHSPDDGGESIIYVLPAAGGNPARVTANGPSYLHGWSPDGKSLVYTGGRNGEYDIYRISVKGGLEVRLTDAKGLDDGPEYMPDGRFIFFNSNRTGPMKIWRMRPDGNGQERITTGDLNDWFPHVSPDGRRLVFLSFPKDVDPGDHPFYKQVYLRMMPAGGGEPRVIAYVYGGQGTINVPSWSPDGRKIAFVSNTAF